MNKTIKTIINVLPIFIVPLITERQKFKEHPDVKKVTGVTVSTSKFVANKTSHAAHQIKTTAGHVTHSVTSNTSQVKDHFATKKRRHDYNKAMKKEAEAQRYRREENIRARGEILEEENRKEINKLNKKLQKAINQRHKEEDKALKKRQKDMVKNMDKMQKYEEKVGHVPGNNDANDFDLASPSNENEKVLQGHHQQSEILNEGQRLEKDNKANTQKLNKKLQKNIAKRRKEEEKQQRKNEKIRKKQLRKLQKNEKHSDNIDELNTLGIETKNQSSQVTPSKKVLKQQKKNDKKRDKQAQKLEKKIQKSAKKVDLAAQALDADQLPPRIQSMSEVQSFEAQTGIVNKDKKSSHTDDAHGTRPNDTTMKQQVTSSKSPQDKKANVATQVDDSLENAPLFKKHYTQMDQHVNDSDQQRKDHQLNKVSQNTLKKLKR